MLTHHENLPGHGVDVRLYPHRKDAGNRRFRAILKALGYGTISYPPRRIGATPFYGGDRIARYADLLHDLAYRLTCRRSTHYLTYNVVRYLALHSFRHTSRPMPVTGWKTAPVYLILNIFSLRAWNKMRCITAGPSITAMAAYLPSLERDANREQRNMMGLTCSASIRALSISSPIKRSRPYPAGRRITPNHVLPKQSKGIRLAIKANILSTLTEDTGSTALRTRANHIASIIIRIAMTNYDIRRGIKRVGWIPTLACLMLAVTLGGCGSCTPAPAYTVPAHWTAAYISTDEVFSYFQERTTCTHYYDNGYSYGYHRRRQCSSQLDPIYRPVRVYHPAVYHPSQFVPAVTCGKS